MASINYSHWSNYGTDPTIIRKVAASLSMFVRKGQYEFFLREHCPKPSDKILDVGITPDVVLKDSNFFEKIYPYKENLVVASVEDCSRLKKTLGFKKFVKISPGKKLPFRSKSFDIVVSWATLEHIGNRKKQKKFLNELLRVGKKIFVTTPDKMSIYEPHSSTFFLHWLSPSTFRMILKMLGEKFWASANNLNILSLKDAQALTRGHEVYVKRFTFFGFSSHIIFYSKNGEH